MAARGLRRRAAAGRSLRLSTAVEFPGLRLTCGAERPHACRDRGVAAVGSGDACGISARGKKRKRAWVWGWEGGPLARAPAAVAGLRGALTGAVLLLLAPRVPGGPLVRAWRPALLGAGPEGSACLPRLPLCVWARGGVGGGGLGWAAGCLGLAALSLSPWPAPRPRLPALAPLDLFAAGRPGRWSVGRWSVSCG